LSEDAVKILDEWIDWLMTGMILKDGLLDTARQFLVQESAPTKDGGS
jgi:hypothetical protein